MYKHRVLLIIFFCSILNGCVVGAWNRYPPPPPTREGVLTGAVSDAVIGAAAGGGLGILGGAAIGGVTGGYVGHIMHRHYTLIEKLQCNGVQVVLIGDEVMIIVPTDRFYKACSPLFNPHYYCILNEVAEFISKFDKIDVKVTAYTDDGCSWRRNLALSSERAEAMVDYLRLKGIDARILYGVGCGAANPIANNVTLLGRQQNRRVVITFRKIVDKVWY